MFIHQINQLYIYKLNSKGNQPWIFIGRTEAPILWSPDSKSRLIRKDRDANKDWRQEEKGTTEGEMAGCITDLTHMSLGELQQVAMDGEAWHAAIHGGRKELDMTECLNWTDLMADSRWVLSENSKILCLALFGTPKLNLSVEFQSTIMKRTSFWGVSSWRSYCSS